jgi:hypothetical protein
MQTHVCPVLHRLIDGRPSAKSSQLCQPSRLTRSSARTHTATPIPSSGVAPAARAELTSKTRAEIGRTLRSKPASRQDVRKYMDTVEMSTTASCIKRSPQANFPHLKSERRNSTASQQRSEEVLTVAGNIFDAAHFLLQKWPLPAARRFRRSVLVPAMTGPGTSSGIYLSGVVGS